MCRKPVILTSLPHYLPGRKGGGPIRSIGNLVDALGGEFDFRVVTSDRDLKDTAPYDGIEFDCWGGRGKAPIFYISSKRFGFEAWRKLLLATSFDMLYLNSLFHPRFTLMPLLAARAAGCRTPMIVAPRGELSPGALALRAVKKKAYLEWARAFKIYRGVTWHATTSEEEALIKHHFGPAVVVRTARNLPTAVGAVTTEIDCDPRLRVVFLSRISPKKNLKFALEVLSCIDFPVAFDIWGPREDEGYWRTCAEHVNRLPRNVEVEYRGLADADQVTDIFARYDLLFLPTLGENYGHVIAEALSAGTPILVSDATPWRALHDAGVGWDLPLSDGPEVFAAALKAARDRCVLEREAWRSHVQAFAKSILSDPALIEESRNLFLGALGRWS